MVLKCVWVGIVGDYVIGTFLTVNIEAKSE